MRSPKTRPRKTAELPDSGRGAAFSPGIVIRPGDILRMVNGFKRFQGKLDGHGRRDDFHLPVQKGFGNGKISEVVLVGIDRI